jgi:flavin reductase (DIM6/NTAB) family NADH-FMN oxidoreductase RutF
MAPSAERFRDVVGHFLSGVTVITVAHGGRRYGTTASAFTSLSLEPPMVVVCLNRASETGAAARAARGFAVNVLGEDQSALALRFGRKGDDKFGDLPLRAGRGPHPLLAGALATLECRIVDELVGGTHRVFSAAVEDAQARPGSPLAYFRGRFERLAPPPDR